MSNEVFDELAKHAIERGYRIRARRRLRVAVPVVATLIVAAILVLPRAQSLFEAKEIAPVGPGPRGDSLTPTAAPAARGDRATQRSGGVSRAGDEPSGTAAPRVAAVPGSRPAEDARGERLAFVSAQGGNNEIYVMNADGSNRRRLTNAVGNDDAPSWAPDGSQIVFVSTRDDGTSALYTMRDDGTRVRRLGGVDGEHAFDPDWSPDGRTIVFTSSSDAMRAGARVWSINVDGSGLRALSPKVDRTATRPTWSPDGHMIAYSLMSAEQPEIYLMNRDGTSRRLFQLGAFPSWSPDGDRIAYVRADFFEDRHAVLKQRVDGSNFDVIDESTDFYGPPSWSSSGDLIAFDRDPDGHMGFGCRITVNLDCAVMQGPRPSSIWTVRSDGTHLRKLTRSGDEFSASFG